MSFWVCYLSSPSRSERTRTVIPSDTELSFRADPNCHSERTRTVIPSEAEESHRLAPGCRLRFFTPLRSVQNDMTWGHPMSFRADTNCHSERHRTVIPSEAEESRLAPGCRLRFFTPLRSVQNDMTWAIRCHSKRTRTVVPSGPELSFRADTNCHSERSRTVIPSEAEESHRLAPGCRLRFFTPLRSVQNDMTWAIRYHSERTRTVVPSDTELSFRAKPRNLTASHRDAASDSSLRCAPFRMT